MYKCIFQSKKKSAIKFTEWVTSEVLPSIRKYGEYKLRKEIERIRKKTKRSIKHWLVTEKGEDYGRIHLHGIVWCPRKRLDQWGYGYTYIGDYVNQKTIAYVTKYMLKICEKWPDFRGKVMCSKRTGQNRNSYF